jgi:hypothetical protein
MLIVSSQFGNFKVHYSYKYGSIRIKSEPQLLNVILVFVKCLHDFLVKFHAIFTNRQSFQVFQFFRLILQ